MSTPHDGRRRTAFRAWVNFAGGIDAAATQTGIARRSIERMAAGQQPPPVRLLEQIGRELHASGKAPAIAADLLSAARAHEVHHA